MSKDLYNELSNIDFLLESLLECNSSPETERKSKSLEVSKYNILTDFCAVNF